MTTPQRVEGTIDIEGARIKFKNFEGRESQFNQRGSRNFCVVLDSEFADQLMADGWTGIRTLKPKDENDVPEKIMQVRVNFEGFKPARIFMITSRGETELDESTVALLDELEVETCDMIISPYNWDMPARGNIPAQNGVSAYLRKMYVIIKEDFLDLKYKKVPQAEDLGLGES